MGMFSSRKKPGMQQPASLLARLFIVRRIFNMLVSLIWPSQEDQEQAGVYLGGEGRDY
ncbi:MAG TPA: hypothetical protein VGK00_08800 [Anaerolineales bacterium]|jgi:hypothetical protein